MVHRDADTNADRRSRRRAAWSGTAAVAGGLVWAATPWVRSAVLGDRPYVASMFDVPCLLGWVLLAAGLVGVRTVFAPQYGRLGRAGVATTAAGMALAAVPTARSVWRFVAAGFRAVPAVGEDPAGLVLTWLTLLGFGLALVGAGAVGLAVRRVADPPTAAVVLLVAAPLVPAAAVVLDLLTPLPLALGRLVVHTNLVLLPFAFGWVALGAAVRARAGRARPAAADDD